MANENHNDNVNMQKLIVFLCLIFLLPLAFVVSNAFVNNAVINYIIYGFAAATPTLSALIVILLFNGIKGMKIFFKKIFSSKFNKRILLLSFLLPLLIIVCSKIISLFFFEIPFLFLIPNAIGSVVILWSLFSEEIG